MTAFDLAQRYIGLSEIEGLSSNPIILKMLKLDARWPKQDEVPWCSAFLNFVAWNLRMPRSKSLLARSWLKVGTQIQLRDAQAKNDVVVIVRGPKPYPGPNVINAPGHAGLYAGHDSKSVYILGGNQGNEVNISPYSIKRVIGVRRLSS